MRYEGQIAETVMMRGHESDMIDAYLARPLGARLAAGVVVYLWEGRRGRA